MIAEFFLSLAGIVGSWFLDMLPDLNWLDGMVLDANNALGSIIVASAQISNWFPVQTLVTVMPLTLGAYIGLFIIKIVRVLLAHVPFVGGKG